MQYGRYGLPYLVLRWGLGITFILVGVMILQGPDNWIGYISDPAPLGMTREGALQAAAVFDLLIGLALVLKFFPKVAGGLAALHLIGIIFTQGIDAVLVRNIGLLGVALALFFWPASHHRKKHMWQMSYWRKKKKVEDDEE